MPQYMALCVSFVLCVNEKICVSVRWVTLWVRTPLSVSIQLVTLLVRPPSCVSFQWKTIFVGSLHAAYSALRHFYSFQDVCLRMSAATNMFSNSKMSEFDPRGGTAFFKIF